MIEGIIGWIRHLLRRSAPRTFRRTAFVPELDDIPDGLAGDVVYIAGSAAFPKWAVFLCPCQRGHVVTLSLQATHRAHWMIRRGRGGPTIHPSVDVHGEPRCHYWVRDGRVTWVPDYP